MRVTGSHLPTGELRVRFSVDAKIRKNRKKLHVVDATTRTTLAHLADRIRDVRDDVGAVGCDRGVVRRRNAEV